jgi:hypothetical protein
VGSHWATGRHLWHNGAEQDQHSIIKLEPAMQSMTWSVYPPPWWVPWQTHKSMSIIIILAIGESTPPGALPLDWLTYDICDTMVLKVVFVLTCYRLWEAQPFHHLSHCHSRCIQKCTHFEVWISVTFLLLHDVITCLMCLLIGFVDVVCHSVMNLKLVLGMTVLPWKAV